MNGFRLLMLVVFVGVCLLAGGLGSMFTSSSVNTWYPELQKPALTPPGWAFPVVWTTLYILMGVAAWLVWRRAGFEGATAALVLFFVQLGLNIAWSGIFFGLRRPGLALLEIALLLAAILATAIAFRPYSRAAFWCMMPYLIWVGFASYLNLRIWRLNS
jgi:translocator protein